MVIYRGPKGQVNNLTVRDDAVIEGDLTAAVGRSVTLMVAASDAPDVVKNQADYICDGTDDHVEIQAALDELANSPSGGVLQLSKGTFTLAADVNATTGVTIRGAGKNATTVSGAFSIDFTGTLGAATEDLAADAERGAFTVDVVDGTTFSANDVVEITGADDEASNSSIKKQRELNVVVSISVNTLTLKFPLSHDYSSGSTDEPAVTVVDTLLEGCGIGDIALSNTDLEFKYVMGFVARNLHLSSAAVLTSAESSSRDVSIEDIVIEDTGGSVSGALLNLHGLTDFRVERVRLLEGGEDGIRVYGCAGGRVNVSCYDVPTRSMWLYKCEHVDAYDCVSVGSKSSTSNIEDTIVDTSRHSGFTRLHSDQPNKTAAASAGEVRGSAVDCYYRQCIIHCHSTTALVLKWSSIRVYIERNTFIVHTSGGTCIGAEDDATAGSAVFIRYNQVDSPDDVNTALFLDNSNVAHTAVVEVLEIVGNVAERQAGSFMTYGGASTGSTTRLVRVEGNFTRDENGGSGAYVSVQRPCDTVVVRGNVMESPATRQVLVNNAVTVYVVDNEVGDVAVSSHTFRRITGNTGYTLENGGTGSINSGVTSTAITHGLDETPSARDIYITLTEDPTNSPGAIWVDNIGATTFQVNCENDPGASNLDFAWRARIN